ncbi:MULTISPECIES: nuclear transport factor 2 family protein [unclassified Streptomyces]|uniref:nuclear transport factor 2 family protein n=1 Tax=unclassified Streptomyces TaxID=2593676 RepID=UPI003810F187
MSSSEHQITQLIGRYAFLVDDGDFAGLGELLDAAEFTLGTKTVRGKAAVEDMAVNTLRTYDDGTPRTRHVTTNLLIDVDEEAGTATSSSYFTVLQQTDGFPLQPVATGRYRDTFERRDGVWRFTRRTVGEQFYGDLSHHVKAAPDA